MINIVIANVIIMMILCYVLDYFVRREVYLLIVIILKLAVAKNQYFIILMHFLSYVYILYGGWKRMAIIPSLHAYDEEQEIFYFFLSIAVWVASVVLNIYKLRPLPKLRKNTHSVGRTLAMPIFIYNALSLLCYTSVMEWRFNTKLNSDNSLGAFFTCSVGMKFIRIFFEGQQHVQTA